MIKHQDLVSAAQLWMRWVTNNTDAKKIRSIINNTDAKKM
jgi:hypothetical protein